MERFSRFLVALFGLIIWQSSLGTTYALKDLSNVTTKSFSSSSSYLKLSNGLLLQLGTTTGVASESFKYLYFPISFYDTNYSILFAGLANETNEKIVYAPIVNTKNMGNVTLLTRYVTDGGGINTTAWRFNWFAIGRWK